MMSKVTLLIVLWTFVLFLFGIMWSMISSFMIELHNLRNEIQVLLNVTDRSGCLRKNSRLGSLIYYFCSH